MKFQFHDHKKITNTGLDKVWKLGNYVLSCSKKKNFFIVMLGKGVYWSEILIWEFSKTLRFAKWLRNYLEGGFKETSERQKRLRSHAHDRIPGESLTEIIYICVSYQLKTTDEEVVPENYPRPTNGQSGCPHSRLPHLQSRTLKTRKED